MDLFIKLIKQISEYVSDFITETNIRIPKWEYFLGNYYSAFSSDSSSKSFPHCVKKEPELY